MSEQLIKILMQCILDLLIELEYADDNQIDPDFCIKTMEIATSELQKIPSPDIKKIRDIIDKIKENETSDDRRIFIEDFTDNFGLE